MDAFLKKVARWVMDHHANNLDGTVMVFPNKRAGLYFRQYLSELIDKPVWCPKITDIKSFIRDLCRLAEPDQWFLVFRLYEIFKALQEENGQKVENIDRFYPWGNMIINDFSDIDKSLANTKELFTAVHELKNIERLFTTIDEEQLEILRLFWTSISLSRDSDEKAKFIRIWEILYELYDRFTESLLMQGYAYEGLMYRMVAEKAIEKSLQITQKTICFTGFYLLNAAEKALFEFCRNEHSTHFFWDFDEELMKRNNFPPARIMKQNLADFPHENDFTLSKSLFGKKQICFYGVALEAGQAKTAGLLIKDYYKEGTGNKADSLAVILPDEKLLLPMLNSLPAEAGNFNITMGYPLKNLPVAALLNQLIILQEKVKKHGEKFIFPFKLISVLFRNPVFRSLCNEDVLNKEKELRASNLIFVSSEVISDLQEELKIVFSDFRDLPSPFNYFMEILKLLYRHQNEDTHPFYGSAILSYYKELNRLKELSTEAGIAFSEQVFFNLLKQVINSAKIPFEGEPLAGLQIMGTLETRCLDFKNLIILSMNEGKWPANSKGSSFIPFSLRKAFNMNTFETEDLTWSYYFYRLLTHSENISLLYNTESGYIGANEMSRYLTQLKYDFRFPVKESVLSLPVALPADKEIIIQKTPEVLRNLHFYTVDSKLKKYLSPSAINAWLDCSLRFYFQYVALISEPKVIQDKIDPATFGTILHEAMRVLYGSRGSGIIDPEEFKTMKKQLDEPINIAFRQQFNSIDPDFYNQGMNLVIKNIIRDYIINILDTDRKYAPFSIVALESSTFKTDIEIELEGAPLKVGLKGTIDRVDAKNDVLRIIDYKTGKDDKSFAGIESLFNSENTKRNKAVMQILFYCFLYKIKYPDSKHIKPGIYNVREMVRDDFSPDIILKDSKTALTIQNFQSVEEQFVIELKKTLISIFDPKTPFIQTQDQDKCEYCAYRGICGR